MIGAEASKSVSHPSPDWVIGIAGSTKEDFKSLLEDLLIDTLGCCEDSVASLDFVQQVEILHKPENDGEIVHLESANRGYVYLNLDSKSGGIYKYLFDSSIVDTDNALELAKLIVKLENALDLKGVKSFVLHNIIEHGKGEIDKIVDILLQRRVRQQIADARGFHPIHYACVRTKTEILRCREVLVVLESLLSNGADPNIPNKSGKTPLHFLARGGDGEVIDAIDILLKAGANPSARDAENYLPIHYACGAEVDGMTSNITSQQVKIIRQLVEAGSKVNAKSKSEGYTPLHCCITSTGQVSQAVEYLLQNKADPNIPENRGFCPIHQVCRGVDGTYRLEFTSLSMSEDDAWDNQYFENSDEMYEETRGPIDTIVLGLLLKYGADPNVEGGPWQQTPLHYISKVAGENKKAAEILLKHKANVNILDGHGLSPVHYLCQEKNWNDAVFNLFLKRGADLNIQSSHSKETPLHLACGGLQNLHIMEKLLNSGANVNVSNKWGDYPIHMVCGVHKKGGLQIRSLRYSGQRESEKFTACQIESHHVTALQLLINKGADVNVISSLKFTPLHIILIGDGKLVSATKLLLENKADPNLKDGDGRYPIHLSCVCTPASVFKENNPETLLELLIKHGAGVNVVDGKQCTALHLAVKCRLPSRFVGKLLQAQAEVNVPDGMGLNPIHHLFDRKEGDPQTNQGTHFDTSGIMDVLPFVNERNTYRQPLGLVYPNSEEHLLMVRRPVDFINLEQVLHQVHTSRRRLTITSDNRPRRPVKRNSHDTIAVLNLLLANNTDVNVIVAPHSTSGAGGIEISHKGISLLHMAVSQMHGIPEVTCKLLKAGANPNWADFRGQTPLHYVCKMKMQPTGVLGENMCKIVHFLLESGASANIADEGYNTPLHFAMKCGVPKITELLLTKGAECKTNMDGMKPQDLVRRDSKEYKMIEEHGPNVQQNESTASSSVASDNRPMDSKLQMLFGAFYLVSMHIGKDWKFLFRRLSPYTDPRETETCINGLEARHSGELKEQAMQALVEWHRCRGQAANMNALVMALKGCMLNDLAEKVEGMEGSKSVAVQIGEGKAAANYAGRSQVTQVVAHVLDEPDGEEPKIKKSKQSNNEYPGSAS